MANGPCRWMLFLLSKFACLSFRFYTISRFCLYSRKSIYTNTNRVTAGGVNGPICHGAGRRHQTVSDYVRAIEYIDANGVHRTVTKPAHLRAAAGCFGLLGIVTHITLLLSPMTYAVLRPTKPDIALAIPPLSPTDIPIALRKSWTPAQYADALKEFEDKANNDYYSEWFWFTRSQQAWVNTWNDTADAEGAVEYPSPFDTFVQWVQGWVGSVLTGSEVFGLLPGRWQACILSSFGSEFFFFFFFFLSFVARSRGLGEEGSFKS